MNLALDFLESVYKQALLIALRQRKIEALTEQAFEVYFRERKIGLFIADLVVKGVVIVELKCCKHLLPEHQAQVINYLRAADIAVGILINFGNKRLEYKRLYHPLLYPAAEGDPAYPVEFFYLD